jgi:hypothetical protein
VSEQPFDPPQVRIRVLVAERRAAVAVDDVDRIAAIDVELEDLGVRRTRVHDGEHGPQLGPDPA